MTQLEALEQALWLAITATDQVKTDLALDLANDLSYGITPEQVEMIKAKIEKRIGGRNEH